jgi:hypothetical protein
MREWSAFFADHPVLLSPTWATRRSSTVPTSTDTDRGDPHTLRPVLPGNLLGLPGAVVPGGTATGCRSACRSSGIASPTCAASRSRSRSRTPSALTSRSTRSRPDVPHAPSRRARPAGRPGLRRRVASGVGRRRRASCRSTSACPAGESRCSRWCAGAVVDASRRDMARRRGPSRTAMRSWWRRAARPAKRRASSSRTPRSRRRRRRRAPARRHGRRPLARLPAALARRRPVGRHPSAPHRDPAHRAPGVRRRGGRCERVRRWSPWSRRRSRGSTRRGSGPSCSAGRGHRPTPANTVTTYGMTETGSGVVYDRRPARRGRAAGRRRRGHLRARCCCAATATARPASARRLVPDRRPRRDRTGRPLTVHGRRGDLIITGGENVWPEPVEAVLRSVPASPTPRSSDARSRVGRARRRPDRADRSEHPADARADPGPRQVRAPRLHGAQTPHPRRVTPPHLDRQTPPPALTGRRVSRPRRRRRRRSRRSRP